MKIILQQNVPALGTAGTLKDVPSVYARNVLFPRKLALPATAESLARWQAKIAVAAARYEEKEKKLKAAIERLNLLKLKIAAAANEQGHLFAKIDAVKISKLLLASHKLEINPAGLQIAEPIRQTGKYEINYRLGGLQGAFSLEVMAEQQKTKR